MGALRPQKIQQKAGRWPWAMRSTHGCPSSSPPISLSDFPDPDPIWISTQTSAVPMACFLKIPPVVGLTRRVSAFLTPRMNKQSLIMDNWNAGGRVFNCLFVKIDQAGWRGCVYQVEWCQLVVSINVMGVDKFTQYLFIQISEPSRCWSTGETPQLTSFMLSCGRSILCLNTQRHSGCRQ